MDSPMEFWGVEVKVGQNVKVDPMDPVSAYIHISQVALGEAKKEKANEPVVVYLKVGDQKIVLGTLKKDDIPHLSLDLVLDSDSELSHSSKSASVFFCGYKVLTDDGNISDFSDSEEEEEALPLKGQDNGKPVTKAEGAKVTKPSKPASVKGASVKQIKTVDPKKEDDSDSDESDDELAGNDESDSDEMDDGSDSDEESESEEETPAKKGKKRQNESASKTPISSKKAKTATPEKTDGKKSVHVATPYPMKKGGKTPKNVTKVQSPTSAGQLSCGSCKRNFANEDGLQQHKKAKHGGQ
ncbi:hypothetical protein LR48_Vigan08g142600 [Vigna angularis]|uniref:Histone deacetylase HDT1 Histone deacetylase n=2 Tax=Phaseolus angularis TaxID=3914 RepID=A0A0L9V7E8_PHAAN|nr:histone deacetylase HDT1 [Vigna angularis]KAG2397489.1 Histone deacetylase HDT1 Histone deacetylase [Vigna angularis]KOM50599.1 hypothetical protein LR48_Vigan08g142600 [Vigna angularis]BAT90469.1 hypothetical protein VIGAN_06171900 [Vigna angularis var. angularis]